MFPMFLFMFFHICPMFFPYVPIQLQNFLHFHSISSLSWGPTSEAHRGRGEAPRPRAVLGPGHPGRESAQAAADHGGTGGTFGQRCLVDGV